MLTNLPDHTLINQNLIHIQNFSSKIESVLERLNAMDDRKMVRLVCAAHTLSISQMAKCLDVTPNTLYRLMKENGLKTYQRFFLLAILTNSVDSVMGE